MIIITSAIFTNNAVNRRWHLGVTAALRGTAFARAQMALRTNPRGQNDDHPPHDVMRAEKLIADVYNAIRANDALWQSTLLVVMFDEHGGFYDHVVPPKAPPPDDTQPSEYPPPHSSWSFKKSGKA